MAPPVSLLAAPAAICCELALAAKLDGLCVHADLTHGVHLLIPAAISGLADAFAISRASL